MTKHGRFGRTWGTLLSASVVLLAIAGGCNARLWAPLHAAAKQNDAAKIRKMVAEGADPNSDKIRGNRTPLWIAAKYKRYNSAKALLEVGANPNRAQGKGVTPLMVASSNGSYQMVLVMLKHGGNPNQPTDEGSNALHYAAARGHAQVLTLLLANKGDRNAVNGAGRTPLDIARDNGHAEAVLALGGKL